MKICKNLSKSAYSRTKGSFKMYVIGLGGSSKIVTKCDKVGGGLGQRVMSPLQKNIVIAIALE